ncbi:MAG: cation transporter [Candidatus Riflebacteria bacterium]|nr:cation transporter [Candidatus Riflebacteria bacterium]
MAEHHHSHDHHSHRGEVTTFAALVSLFSNLFLTCCKLAVGWWIDSAAVISEGLHSATDLLASGSAYFSVRLSSQPPDETHPFGHGKFEDMAAVFEAGLIVLAAIGVIWKATVDFLRGAGPTEPELGMGVMVVSIAVNTVVSRYLFSTAKEHDSVALEADAWHLSADVLTSVGVMVGLLLVHVTGLKLFDPLAALGVAVYILFEATRVGRKGFENLVDSGLPPDEVSAIEAILAAQTRESVQFHGLRTRKAGPERHIDLHLVVDRDMPTGQAHDLCHVVEDAIRGRFPTSKILIHLESSCLLHSHGPQPLHGPLPVPTKLTEAEPPGPAPRSPSDRAETHGAGDEPEGRVGGGPDEPTELPRSNDAAGVDREAGKPGCCQSDHQDPDRSSQPPEGRPLK